MKSIIAALTITLAAIPSANAAQKKKVRVVTTLSVLAALTREVGGNNVSVKSLANGKQDPHTLVAKPTFKLAARKADLFVEIGLGLDKWGTAVTDASGNPAIQTGQPGRVIASEGIRTKELPRTLSKAWGDIHPYGNPHVWLDPVNAKQIARNIRDGLVRIDPERAADYTKREKQFERRVNSALYGPALVDEYGASKLDRLSSRGRLLSYLDRKGTANKLGGWLAKAKPLRGLKIIAYHKSWIYFADRFGMQIISEIEEKPGIPPSQSYLHKLIGLIQNNHVRVLYIDTFYPLREGKYLAGKTTAKIVSNPLDVGGVAGASDYFSLINVALDRTLAALR